VRLHLADPGRALLARLDRRAAAQERRIEQALGGEQAAALRGSLEAARAALERAPAALGPGRLRGS
jgi:DNA-binding MarR family transcriptional regulator